MTSKPLLTYRRPMPPEAQAFAALHVQCWREAYVNYLPPHLMESFSAEKRVPIWQGMLATADRIIIGAYENERPVGFIVAGSAPERLIENQDGHVWALYIAQAVHRRGVGRALMGLAAQKWLAWGGATFTIGVLRANAPARAFYEAIGAKLASEGIYNWDGYPLEDCVYFLDTAALVKLAHV